MRKVIPVLLAAVAILGFQAQAHPATLQAGWYVDVSGGMFWWEDVFGDLGGASGEFSTPAGAYGPFQVAIPGFDSVPRTVGLRSQHGSG